MDMGYEQGGSGLIETSIRGFYFRPQIKFHSLRGLNETISFLAGISRNFPEVSTLIFGNAMDLSVNHEKCVMDIPELGDHLEAIKDACPQYKIWLELPGFMLSQAAKKREPVILGSIWI